jgi:GGDEF domain-containing protein
MVRIALILKGITRRQGRGWPIRFKSNETGILLNKCTPAQAEAIADDLAAAVANLPSVPAGKDIPAFSFTGTISWGVWPQDDGAWDGLLQGTYKLLLDTCKQGGNQVIHYQKDGTK